MLCLTGESTFVDDALIFHGNFIMVGNIEQEDSLVQGLQPRNTEGKTVIMVCSMFITS